MARIAERMAIGSERLPGPGPIELHRHLPRRATPETHPVLLSASPEELSFPRWLVRGRRWIFLAIALLMLLGFNGQWRVGNDSSQYRGIADNIASGRGYTFGGVHQSLIYPGLPYLLAGAQKWFGSAAWPGVLAVMLMSGATLVVTYKLLSLHAEKWVAVAVVVGVALNERFTQLSQELMTDIPFTLGVVLAFYGWSLLHRKPVGRQLAGAIAALVFGLALAASMRPTFWLLAIAWVITCVAGLFTPRRKLYAIGLASLFAVWLLVLAIDPRIHGVNALEGGYEQSFFRRIPNSIQSLRDQILPVFWADFPEAFFGEHMQPFSILLSLSLVAGLVLLLGRFPLWGLFGLLTLATTLAFDFSSTPRYYLPVLPVLWFGWITLALRVTRRLRPSHRNLALAGAIAIGVLPNLGGIVRFIIEQRRPNFLAHYRRGQVLPMLEAARLIREKVPQGARVIGPHANLLTYLSGRAVTGADELLAERAVKKHLDVVREFAPQFMIFPARYYRDRDTRLVPLMQRKLISARSVIAESGEVQLAVPRIQKVQGDWRDPQPPVATQPATLPSVKKKKKPTTASAATQPATKKVKKPTTAVTKKKKKTAAATHATSTATTHPAKKKKKKPASSAVVPSTSPSSPASPTPSPVTRPA